jgi:hypothetical protein
MQFHWPEVSLITSLSFTILLVRRIQVVLAMNKFKGKWEAFVLVGRDLGPKIEGAFLTSISPRWLSLEPGLLDVRAQDWDASKHETRPHHGQIKIDPVFRRQGVRTVIYSNEIAHQRIEFGDSSELIYVASPDPGYGRHALRRTNRLIDY